MFGDIEVQNAAAIVADDEKAVEHAEVDRRNSKEIHRGNSFLVVTQKGKPVLARSRILAPSSTNGNRRGAIGPRFRR